MAATAVKYGETWTGDGTRYRMEFGVITYDSDATVEVPTSSALIYSASFAEVASGGSADLPSVDETLVAGRISVPTTGKITVDTAGNSTRAFFYTLIGQ